MNAPRGRAVLYGLAAGMRTSAPAVACAAGARPWEWYALLGECVVDKLPWTPSRLLPGGWLGRITSATYGAVRDARRRDESVVEAVAVAAVTATVATKVFHDLRAALTKNGPFSDTVVAVLEDGLTLACVVALRDGVSGRELPEVEGHA